MDKIEIHLATSTQRSNYPIFIGSQLLSKIPELFQLKQYSKVAVIVDENVAGHWLLPLVAALGQAPLVITIQSGEQFKSLETLAYIWGEMVHGSLDRRSLVINLGGGVVGDMGGFAAASYMRGLDFIQIPTTLLAQVDASVGGKLAIDFAGVKNIIGSFSQPLGVVIDINTLSTLPQREYQSGFAEVLKHGLIKDKAYFDYVCSKPFTEFTAAEVVRLITQSCKIKAAIVEQDERESGQRKLLNFGHTFGHAFEALSIEVGEPLLHGEAIAIGMVAEAHLSAITHKADQSIVAAVEKAMKHIDLPTRFEIDRPFRELLNYLKHDKKSAFGQIRWTLLKSVGAAVIDQKIKEQLVEQSFNYVTNS